MTHYEQKAEWLLAKRGEQDAPKPLIVDLAKWLEEAHNDGHIAGVGTAIRIIRDAKLDLAELEKHLREAQAP